MEYTIDCVMTFVKFTNLEKWYMHCNRENAIGSEKRYTKVQPVYLSMQVCYKGSKTYCRIKCPINPLPVKGWFETPSINVLKEFLSENGWNFLMAQHGELFPI